MLVLVDWFLVLLEHRNSESLSLSDTHSTSNDDESTWRLHLKTGASRFQKFPFAFVATTHAEMPSDQNLPALRWRKTEEIDDLALLNLWRRKNASNRFKQLYALYCSIIEFVFLVLSSLLKQTKLLASSWPPTRKSCANAKQSRTTA